MHHKTITIIALDNYADSRCFSVAQKSSFAWKVDNSFFGSFITIVPCCLFRWTSSAKKCTKNVSCKSRFVQSQPVSLLAFLEGDFGIKMFRFLCTQHDNEIPFFGWKEGRRKKRPELWFDVTPSFSANEINLSTIVAHPHCSHLDLQALLPFLPAGWIRVWHRNVWLTGKKHKHRSVVNSPCYVVAVDGSAFSVWCLTWKRLSVFGA